MKPEYATETSNFPQCWVFYLLFQGPPGPSGEAGVPGPPGKRVS